MADDRCVTLEIPPDGIFASPLAGVAKALAARSGIAPRESYRYQLTVEEFCLCLADLAEGSLPLRVTLTGQRHQLRAAFSFKAAHLSLGALNVTSRVMSGCGDQPAADLGLLLAGKAADRFHVKRQRDDLFLLEAAVDKAYPEAMPVHRPDNLRPPYTVRSGHDPAQLTRAAAMAIAAYPVWNCPLCFRTPEKFADMVADGEIACVLVCDATGQTAGLMTWSPCSDQALYFSGPFLFTPADASPEVARLLVDTFLATVARDRYTIVLSFRSTPDLPQASFESLGFLRSAVDGQVQNHPVLFRHLHEDNGLAVWCSPRLEDFLRQAYDRLALPRDILPVEDPVGRPKQESLLGATIGRLRQLGELEPFLDGDDMAANLAAHVAAFHRQGITNILYYMDLSTAWQAALAKDLLEAGFVPRVLLPLGGQADKVVWQHGQPA